MSQRAKGRGRRRGTGGERPMVPDANFTSYYGRPIVKASPWKADVPAYLLLGGLAAGSSLLAAGADLTHRPALRRSGRWGALAAIIGSLVALVHDLGRPGRFLHMLRVAKPTSPMSMGTWLLTAYAPVVGIAAAGEALHAIRDDRDTAPPPRRSSTSPAVSRLPRLLVRMVLRALLAAERPAGLAAASLAPAVASYTAVLLADTATPAWHEGHRELPLVFVGSAAAAAGGLAMMVTPAEQAAPARRLAAAGALAELLVERRRETAMGIAAETLHGGRAGRLMTASRLLTAGGAVGAVTAARAPRALATLSGAALLTGSACTRFGIFEAGQASARDPRYTVVPQRQRLSRGARPAQTERITLADDE